MSTEYNASDNRKLFYVAVRLEQARRTVTNDPLFGGNPPVVFTYIKRIWVCRVFYAEFNATKIIYVRPVLQQQSAVKVRYFYVASSTFFYVRTFMYQSTASIPRTWLITVELQYEHSLFVEQPQNASARTTKKNVVL